MPLSVFPRSESTANKWARRRDIPIAILAWTALVIVILWGVSHIAGTILLLTIAGLLAYALSPGVKLLQGFMPRILAILIVYLLVLGVTLRYLGRTSGLPIAGLLQALVIAL